MFFYLSKIFWWLFDPGNILFLLLFLGVFSLLVGWRKSGKLFCTLAFLFYFVVGMLPIAEYALNTLENRFPQVTELPQDVDGIVVLGGAINVLMSDERNELSVNDNVERVLSLVHLTKAYPDVPIIYSGGPGLIGRPDLNESDMIEPLLKELVAPGNKLHFEKRSRNTHENAVFTKEMIDQIGDGKWLLVTSATHMPRSVGAYRLQGIDVIPFPVAYLTSQNFSFSLSLLPRSGLGSFRSALHEWLGLSVYYFTGKTTEFFPAPK